MKREAWLIAAAIVVGAIILGLLMGPRSPATHDRPSGLMLPLPSPRVGCMAQVPNPQYNPDYPYTGKPYNMVGGHYNGTTCVPN